MNPSFQELKRQFQDASLSEPDYIRAALQAHKALFDYVEVTRSTDVREIAITPDGVSFVLGEERIRLYCPENEARAAPLEVMNFTHYEPEETRAMDILAANSRHILDVGAHIGLHAIRFAKRLPRSRIFAFEPLPTNHAFLQRNVAVNGVGERVTCFNFGLSETAGVVEFFLSPASSANASHDKVSDVHKPRSVMGLTQTMDQWASNHQLVPDFIKCTVEGAELPVLRGGHSTLVRHQPIVYAELLRKWCKPFGYHPNDVLTYFADLGYQCFAIAAAGARRITAVTDETPEIKYAFLHTQRHAATITQLVAQP